MTNDQAITNAADEATRFLSGPAAYAERPVRVEVVQTHISQIFMTDQFVYKRKKPVKFPFLDFSTLAARQWACREELRLNRRLAPSVYVAVVPLTRDPSGKLHLDGGGEVVDWLVKMRRLPAARALDRLICRGELTDADMARLTVVLTTFYEQMPPLTVATDEYVRRLREHVRDNLQELLEFGHGLSGRLVRRVHAAQLRMLSVDEELFRHRVLDGRVLDGHGDLRPEHIYLTVPPAVIDCIEFNREFRELDVADELSFFAMECEHLGNAAVGQAVFDAYQQHTGDAMPDALLAFYKSYRACVRAKVLLLRKEHLEPREQGELDNAAAEYLELAERYAAQLGPPHAIVVGGLMGCGKTTLAAALADRLGCEILHTDEVRRELFGPAEADLRYGEGRYQPRQRERVYDEMHRRAGRLLDEGMSVVLDGTYLQNHQRRAALDLARRSGAAALLVECRCPDELAARRMRGRRQAGPAISDGRPALLESQKREYEPPDDDLPVVQLDSSQEAADLQAEVLQRLSDALHLETASPSA